MAQAVGLDALLAPDAKAHIQHLKDIFCKADEDSTGIAIEQ